MSSLRITSAAFFALMLASSSDAFACSCAPAGPPCQNTFQAGAVFSGTVRSITIIPEDGPPLGPDEMRFPRAFRVEFDIISAFRGIDARTATVLTASNGPACGYAFEEGERYLVYAHRNRDGGLVASICSRTQPLGGAGEDLRFLETLSAPIDGARISGTIQHWERDLSTGQPERYGPVRDLRVTARGPNRTFETRTDADGAYEMILPPGEYELSVMAAPGFTEQRWPGKIAVRDARSCFVADFGVQFDGRIRGAVTLSSGKPAQGVSVDVLAAEDILETGYVQTLNAVTDAQGRFEFLDISPGRYVVGVDLIRKMDPNVVFPATFHPGTTNPALATIVELTGGQHIDLQPMMLPPARRVRRLSGAVVWADGKPAAGAHIVLRDGERTVRQISSGATVGEDGTFSLVVHEGLSYVISATHRDVAGKRQFSGSLGPVLITEDVAGLKVLLPPQGIP